LRAAHDGLYAVGDLGEEKENKKNGKKQISM